MMTPLILTTAAAAAVLLTPIVRRHVITRFLMSFAAKQLPTIGDTERIALEAGTVGWEGELFSGHPNWKNLFNFAVKPLSDEEKAFLEGPVEQLCKLIDDDGINQDRDMSKKAWDFIKANKFFGMIIPKEHGGLGFSAAAHAAVVTKLASRSVASAVTVMVPNSLGPGELLLHYGTPEQQKHYLPRLAKGLDIPCFALTEPTAGSDAASGLSFGTVTHGMWQGKKILGMKLTFNKRYITLAPVATVVGLAFRLNDPEHLLGDKEDIGITCALLPRATKGLVIGNRHDPMGVPFPNGPVSGKDVFVPLDYIIGGPAQAGNGWRMLMECLSTGRGISLPSLSVGAAQVSLRAASAYGAVREQFGMSINKFEGVRERIARIIQNTFVMNAAGRLTVGMVDDGQHPSVASAIAKAYLTEGMRLSINDGMDIFGGAAICRGPRNIFARPYSSIPIGITVEGSNILTRSLIVFGQGAIRCHPYLQAEVNALGKKDLKAFDAALFGHIAHIMANSIRAFVLAFVPSFGGTMRRHKMRLTRLSAAFALIADFGLVTLGGALKRKEYLSGRYADAFAWLYLGSAVLKHAHDVGLTRELEPLVNHSLLRARVEIESALDGVLANLPNRPIAWLARLLAFPLGMNGTLATDRLTDKMIESVFAPDGNVRNLLTGAIHIPAADQPGLGQLENTYQLIIGNSASRKKIMDAMRRGEIKSRRSAVSLIAAALQAEILTPDEAVKLHAAEEARLDTIQVDHFPPATYKKLR